MVAVEVLFPLLIVFFVSGQGLAQQPCGISSISIDAAKTGQVVKGQPEFEVVITNNCICSESNVVIRCDGIQSVEPLDPKVIRPEGNGCLLNDGVPIFQGQPFKFKFAGQTPTNLIPISSQPNCS